MKNYILIIFTIFFFSSCVSPIKPYNDIVCKSIAEPKIGEVVTKNIGDTLIAQGTLYTIKAVAISDDCLDGNVKRGIYKAVATRKIVTNDQSSQKTETKNIIRFGGKGLSGVKWAATGYYLDYYTEDDRLFYVYTSGSANVTQPGKVKIENFKITETSYPSPDSFQQTLLYLGKSGSVVRFGYREFYEDYARPAFSNEVSYDLNDSNIIGYKNAKIKIIEATNTFIKYEVLSHF